jgi:hypothetical protein
VLVMGHAQRIRFPCPKVWMRWESPTEVSI